MRKTNVIIAIFIAIVLIALAVVLLTCTVFVVRHIEVEGNVASALIQEERIVDASGISIGNSIISINKAKVKSSIEKENPYIEVIFVEREFPNTIIIKVTVRTAIMAIPVGEGDVYAVVDSGLKVLELVPAERVGQVSSTVISGAVIAAETPTDIVGTDIPYDEDASMKLLHDLAVASDDPNLDLSGVSFRTFFKSIEISQTQGGFVAYIRTNTGVKLVIDTSLTTDVYTQLSLCMFVYNSNEVNVDKTSGYIALDKNSTVVAYKWLENLN